MHLTTVLANIFKSNSTIFEITGIQDPFNTNPIFFWPSITITLRNQLADHIKLNKLTKSLFLLEKYSYITNQTWLFSASNINHLRYNAEEYACQ